MFQELPKHTEAFGGGKQRREDGEIKRQADDKKKKKTGIRRKMNVRGRGRMGGELSQKKKVKNERGDDDGDGGEWRR